MKKLSKTKKRYIKRFITVVAFVIFSSVLFINNATQLLERFSILININLITWIGLILTILYTLWKVINGEM